MDVRPLGGSGVSVSRVGLGGIELGPATGEDLDVDRAVEVIAAAIDAGVNWVDTSENYLETRNESLIGAALTGLDPSFLVATKVAPGGGTGGGSGFRHDEIHAACRASLRRLDRDVIDLYFLHWPDDTGAPLDETWGAMGELVHEGLVRAIGMSNYELADIQRCHEQRAVDVVQTGLSMIDYLDDRALVARCGELGIGVVIYEPLASGILTGRTMEQVRAIWTGPWMEAGFYTRLLAAGKAERSFAVAGAVAPIAQRLGATVAQIAIGWVLRQQGVTAAIAGSRDRRHIQQNALAANLDLAAVADELDALISLGPTFSDA